MSGLYMDLASEVRFNDKNDRDEYQARVWDHDDLIHDSMHATPESAYATTREVMERAMRYHQGAKGRRRIRFARWMGVSP